MNHFLLAMINYGSLWHMVKMRAQNINRIYNKCMIGWLGGLGRGHEYLKP